MDIKVVSFNILCTDKKGDNSIKSRLPRLYDTLKKTDADIYCLQECTPKWLRLLKKCFIKEYRFYNARRGGDNQSLCIMWKKEKFTCKKQGKVKLADRHFLHFDYYEGKYKCHRIFAYCTLKTKSGELFSIVNVHVGFGDDKQKKTAQMLCDFADKRPCPVLIAGDFNAEPDSHLYSMMCEKFTDANAALERDMRPTYHGFFKRKCKHLDYIFVDNRINPLQYTLLCDTTGGCPSDHYGIEVIFCLNL